MSKNWILFTKTTKYQAHENWWLHSTCIWGV